jgi:hypothetical protein
MGRSLEWESVSSNIFDTRELRGVDEERETGQRAPWNNKLGDGMERQDRQSCAQRLGTLLQISARTARDLRPSWQLPRCGRICPQQHPPARHSLLALLIESIRNETRDPGPLIKAHGRA